MKIVTVLGARPQFIKAVALSRAVAKRSGIQEIIVHTGQHYDENMSDVFFHELGIPKPSYNLKISGKLHGEMTGRMIEGIEMILIDEAPDFVVVYGDTNSTLAGALAAKKLRINVVHIEAGLRSFNMKMPEEVNRILTDRVSDFLFCPGHQAVFNLKQEGFDRFDCQIFQVGDIMKDVASFYKPMAKRPSFDVPEKFILATLHRAENTDSPIRLNAVLQALEEISKKIPVILPMHPRTKEILEKMEMTYSPGLFITDPVGYLEMIYLLTSCRFVMTDSGGLQKEAYFFKKECIILREETEWIELVEAGYNHVVGTEFAAIVKAANLLLHRDELSISNSLYGDGNTAERIVEILMK